MNSHAGADPDKPNPHYFGAFLPWACRQFASYIDVVVKDVHYEEPVPKRSKSKASDKLTKTSDVISEISELSSSEASLFQTMKFQAVHDDDSDKIHIQAIYDSLGNFNEIKIMNNRRVSSHIIQILQLVIEFYPFLESLTINRGVDQYTMYEISKLLPLSNITELCLDDTVLEQANYYMLLDNPNKLKYLSLSRCRINDNVVQKIAERLEYPQSASKTLSTLYLSMNRITDIGAKSLANSLRSNRKLSYLNLSGNMIGDDGAIAILSVLLEFPLTPDDVTASRARHLEYVKSKNAMILELSRNARRNNPIISNKKIALKRPFDSSVFEKAFETAKLVHGDRITDTFIIDIVEKKNVTYNIGNNSLAYINLAYNNLSQHSLKKIIQVLNHQNNLNRSPKGLVKLKIEGNPFHESAAKYLFIIDSMLQLGLSVEVNQKGKKPKPAASKTGSRY